MASGRTWSYQAWAVGAFAGALFFVVILPVTLLASRQGGTPRTGKQVYEAACIQCHGANGTGVDRSTVGFDLPLPDLSDCNFTREPDADWYTVVHDGGPVRAFNRLMPSFAEALSHDEITAVIAHVRGFCGSLAWPRGELNFPRAIVTEKAFPEDEFLFIAGVATGSPGEVGYKAIYEKRLGARSQVEVIIPFATLEADAGGWTTNVGDVAFGAKSAVYHNRDHVRSDAAVEVALPTGNEDRGFGRRAHGSRGLPGVRPGAARRRLHPGPGGRRRADQWRHEGGLLAARRREDVHQGRFGRSWSPMVELVAAKDLADGEVVHWDIVPQFQVTLSRRQHIMAAFGARVPLNERDGRHTQVLTYFLWDWFDGGLFSAWK